MRFSGSNYEKQFDNVRLSGQLAQIFNLMRDGLWRSLDDIARITHAPAASVSAQLRNLRKPQFGGHFIEKKSFSDRARGLWLYRLMVHRPAVGAKLAPPKPPLKIETGPTNLPPEKKKKVNELKRNIAMISGQPDLFQ